MPSPASGCGRRAADRGTPRGAEPTSVTRHPCAARDVRMTTFSFLPADLAIAPDDLAEFPTDVPDESDADPADDAAGLVARHPSGYAPGSALDRPETFDSWA